MYNNAYSDQLQNSNIIIAKQLALAKFFKEKFLTQRYCQEKQNEDIC